MCVVVTGQSGSVEGCSNWQHHHHRLEVEGQTWACPVPAGQCPVALPCRESHQSAAGGHQLETKPHQYIPVLVTYVTQCNHTHKSPYAGHIRMGQGQDGEQTVDL